MLLILCRLLRCFAFQSHHIKFRWTMQHGKIKILEAQVIQYADITLFTYSRPWLVTRHTVPTPWNLVKVFIAF